MTCRGTTRSQAIKAWYNQMGGRLIGSIYISDNIRYVKTTINYIINLDAPGIRGCQGCFHCRTNDGCAVKDYLQPMYKAITEADAIVFGSPIYGYQITGQAKIWLDRTFPMVGDNFAPRHPGKKVISIFVQGGLKPEMGAEGIKVVNDIFARYGWKLEDSIHYCGTTDFHSEKFERFNASVEKFEELSLRAFKDGENLVK